MLGRQVSVLVVPVVSTLPARAGALTALAGALVCSGVLSAAAVTVDCGNSSPPPGTYSTVSAALGALNLSQPNQITVTGSCAENVLIGNAEDLTIEAPPTQMATISASHALQNTVTISGSRNVTLRRLVLHGGRGVSVSFGHNVLFDGSVLENSSSTGLSVRNDSSVTLSGPSTAQPGAVRGNGSPAISADGGQLTLGPNLIMEDNAGQAISSTGTRLSLTAGSAENIIRNNGGGLSLNTSVVTFDGQNTIQNNGSFGVRVTGGQFFATERVLPDGSVRALLIEGHGNVGLFLNMHSEGGLFGRHRIRGNGGAPSSAYPPAAGVQVFSGSAFQMGNGAQVTGNTGPGIVADLGSTAVFGFQTDTVPSAVTGNTEEGLRLTMLSAARFLKPTAMAGGANTSMTCDGSSIVTGDLTGISDVGCKVEKK